MVVFEANRQEENIKKMRTDILEELKYLKDLLIVEEQPTSRLTLETARPISAGKESIISQSVLAVPKHRSLTKDDKTQTSTVGMNSKRSHPDPYFSQPPSKILHSLHSNKDNEKPTPVVLTSTTMDVKKPLNEPGQPIMRDDTDSDRGISPSVGGHVPDIDEQPTTLTTLTTHMETKQRLIKLKSSSMLMIKASKLGLTSPTKQHKLTKPLKVAIKPVILKGNHHPSGRKQLKSGIKQRAQRCTKSFKNSCPSCSKQRCGKCKHCL